MYTEPGLSPQVFGIIRWLHPPGFMVMKTEKVGRSDSLVPSNSKVLSPADLARCMVRICAGWQGWGGFTASIQPLQRISGLETRVRLKAECVYT